MVENVLEKLIALFTESGARFRVVEHPQNGKSSLSVSEIRGTELGQGAKALVTHIKGNGVNLYCLAVLPADRQADLSKIAAHFGARRASLASPDEVMELTGCVPGSVPPVSFHEKLVLVIDPSLYERYEEIAFNAGRLDHSIIISAQDFRKAVEATEMTFLREAD